MHNKELPGKTVHTHLLGNRKENDIQSHFRKEMIRNLKKIGNVQ